MIFVMILLLLTADKIKATAVAPPEFTEMPTWPAQNYYDENGPDIVLKCRITDVPHTLVWFKDGHMLDPGKELLLLEDRNQSLRFEVPKQNQSGEYRCLASNIAGNVSHSGTILITARMQETRPRIVKMEPASSVAYAYLGDVVNISCMFDVGGSVEALMDETDYGTYQCYGQNSQGNDSKLLSVLLPEPNQKDFSLDLIIGCSVGGFVAFLALATVVVGLVLRRRYLAKLKYEELEWLKPDAAQYDVPDRKLKYDVFISYSSEDLTWVKDVLFYTLCDHGYEVCIDFKDFIPGNDVADNIMDAVYKSRKTIVLLSKNFLKSMWGQFELQQAHHRAIVQRSDVLIIIKYDNSKVPTRLMGKTFLDWSDPKVRPHFWTRLDEAIGEPGSFLDPDDKFEVPEFVDEPNNQRNILADFEKPQTMVNETNIAINGTKDWPSDLDYVFEDLDAIKNDSKRLVNVANNNVLAKKYKRSDTEPLSETFDIANEDLVNTVVCV